MPSCQQVSTQQGNVMIDKSMSHARLGVAVLPVGAGEVAVGAGFRGAREW